MILLVKKIGAVDPTIVLGCSFFLGLNTDLPSVDIRLRGEGQEAPVAIGDFELVQS